MCLLLHQPSMSTPSLSDAYSVATLPRITDVPLESKVTLPTITSTDTSIIDVGVSKSIISSYLLKPTPKLIWSYPLSPSTIVDCMDVCVKADGEDKIYAIGLTERKNNKLLVIDKVGNGNKIEQINSKTEIKVGGKITNLKIINGYIYVIYEKGSIELYKINQEEVEKIEFENEFNHFDKVEYSKFINEKELLVITKKNTTYHYKIFQLEMKQTKEIINQSIKETNSKLIFGIYSNTLYKLSNETISSVSTTNFKKVLKSMNISNIITKDCKISMHTPSLERILLSIDKSIYLVNFKFESLLAQQTNQGESLINQVIHTKGDSINTRNTFAIFSENNERLNNTDLKILQVNVGVNKLNECLGKKIDKAEEVELQGIPNLLSQDLEKEDKEQIKQMNKVYQSLEKLSKKADLAKFDNSLLEFFKNGHAGNVYDEETDLVIDENFINQVVKLIFKLDNNQLCFQNNQFIPEASLRYLLSHPCYPYEYTIGILKLFKDFKQESLLANLIKESTSIKLEELLKQLVYESIDENFAVLQIILTRIIEEYSIIEITSILKKILGQFNKIEIDLINSLIKLNSFESLQLIQVIIDIGGLFNWNTNIIESLTEFINDKIESLIENSFNLTLTNQAILQTTSQTKKSKKKNLDNIISNDLHQQQQLDSILTITNNSSKKIHLGEDGIEISKKVPKYSIEKLVL